MNDLEALRRFAEVADAGAFQEVVRRHVDLVYAAARRQMRDAAGAQDVTQGVFLLLMNKAGGLARGNRCGLAGWLLAATHFACRAARRAEARRAYHERKAMRMRQVSVDAAEAGWAEIAPALDGALMGLSTADRAAVGMRCLEERTFVEVGAALGISEEAARKRVERALEKLRALLAKQDVAAPAGLAGMLATHGTEKAPPSFVAGLGLPTGAASPASAIAKGTAKLLWWGQVKVAATAAAALTALGVMTSVAVWKEYPLSHAIAITAVGAERGVPATTMATTGPFGGERIGDRLVLRGRLVDAEGKAVPGVPYRVWNHRPWPSLTMEKEGNTGSDGDFTTGPVAPDPSLAYGREILLDAPGYALAWWSPITNDVQWRPHRVVLQKGMVVSGTVRDEAGNAVFGASVEAMAQSNLYGSLVLDAPHGLAVKTDAAGRFTFERIPPGTRMHVTAQLAGHATASTWDGYHGNSYPVTAGTTDVELTMGKEAIIRMQLMHEGKPAAQAGVVILATEKDKKMWRNYGPTDAAGKAELQGLCPGTWSISEDEPTENHRHVNGPVVKLVAGEVKELALPYEEGILVSGTVHDGAGHPVQNPVSVQKTDAGVAGDSLTPDGAGHFAMHLLPGKYAFTSYGWPAGKLQGATHDVDVHEGMEPMDFVAEARPQMKGQLVDVAGKGIKGMIVFGERCAYTDDDGRFQMTIPDLDDKVGVALNTQGTLGKGIVFDPADSGDLRLVLEPMGAITGRVVDGAGNGVADAHLLLDVQAQRGEGGMALDEGHWVWRIEVKSDGTYRIAPVPTGYSLEIIAERDDWLGHAPVEMLQPGEEKVQEVVLRTLRITTRAAKRIKQMAPPAVPHNANISGRLLDANGAPLVGWQVSWMEGNNDSWTSTDLKGRFVLEELPAAKIVKVRAQLQERKGEWLVETGKEGVELKINP